MAAAAIDKCLTNRDGIAEIKIVVNTIEQVDQFKAALNLFPRIPKKANLDVTCSAANPDCSAADLLIVDECHRASSPSWAAIIGQAKKARWGLSATPFSDDQERNAILRGLFTDTIHAIEREQLVEDGHLTPARVIWRDVNAGDSLERIDALSAELIAKRKKKNPFMFRTDYNGEPTKQHQKQIHQCRWQAAQRVGLWENQWRDCAIVTEANELVTEGQSVIVLISNKEHGASLCEAITGAVRVFSGMGVKRRREAIAGFRSGSIRCIVATSAIEEGFDAPCASAVIMAGAGKSERKAIQSTGRVLRPYDGKSNGLIVDFKDAFHPMLKRQAAKRRKIYNDLNYK